jgi:NADH:quinone reductase (non-electrogenic)
VLPKVVIVGGGFGGLNAAKALGGTETSVTLIDRRNHHLFQPLLYEVATAGLSPSEIAFPIRSILRKHRNIRVLLADVTGVDVQEGSVSLDDGTALPYDFLVVATGATHSYFGHDDWTRDAPGLKTIEDAIEIRRRILLSFEEAERSVDAEERRRLLTFVVIGGGPTGVELAGAIAGIATRTMTSDFRSIDPSAARIILVEGSDRLLGSFSARLSRRAQRQLEKLGVDVRTSTMVTDIDTSGVETSAGRIDSRCVLWAAGVAASPLGRDLGADTDRTGRVTVGADLSVAGHPGVFVIGDLAHVVDRGRDVPGVAPAAMQQGTHVAEVILADLGDRPRPVFHYSDKGSLAQVGRTAAVARLGRFEFSGFVAWMLWWSIHIAYLIGFRSRVLVLFGWGWQWLTVQRAARLITTPWSPSSGSGR